MCVTIVVDSECNQRKEAKRFTSVVVLCLVDLICWFPGPFFSQMCLNLMHIGKAMSPRDENIDRTVISSDSRSESGSGLCRPI